MATKDKNTDEFEEEQVSPKEELQIDKVKKTYVLLTNHWDTLERNIPKNKNAFFRFIAAYRNKYIKILETPYPIDYPILTPECIRQVYQCAGVNPQEFLKDVMTIRGWEGYEDKYLSDKAPYILLMMMERYFILNKMYKEKVMLEHYIGYFYYWGAFLSIFKKYKPKKEVMEYTINEMSYKSKLKVLGSVDAWLADGVASTFDTYSERIIRGSDFELHYINEKIRSKFKAALKTIFRAQMKNEQEGHYIFTSKTHIDDNIVENPGGLAEVLSLANKYSSKFFEEPINEEALKGCMIKGAITSKDLRKVLLIIADNPDNRNDVTKLFQCLFNVFLEGNNFKARDIGTVKFYIEMEKLYKPGNTTDPNRTYIKEVLDKWLSLGSATFRTTNRIATITSFRKSIYMYFVLKIMKDK